MMDAVHGPEMEALTAQLGDLVALVGDLSDDDFSRPTRCPGWSVAELVAHCEGILLRLVGEIPAGRVIERSDHPRITYGEFVASRNLEAHERATLGPQVNRFPLLR